MFFLFEKKERRSIPEKQTFFRGFSSSVKGFSFMEVMISLFVLSVGFLGVIGLARVVLVTSFQNRDALIASQLSQEGVELVYNIRDNNIVNGASDEFDNIGTFPQGYRIASSFSSYTTALEKLAGISPQLRVDATTNFYQYTSGALSKFSRRISIANGSGGDTNKRVVTSEVIWAGDVFPAPASCTKANKCVLTTLTLQK